MSKIIAIVNQKGGVGKTTTTINLGASLAALEKNILLIDIDPQCNTSTGVGFDFGEEHPTIYNVFLEEAELQESVHSTVLETLSYIPSDRNLVGLELEFADKPNRNFLLKEKIKDLRDKYDYIFIDCPPSLNTLTLNALAASDSVLIPLQTEYYAMEGLVNLSNTLELVKKSLNPYLTVEGILFTMYDSRNNLSKMVVTDVKAVAPFPIFNTIIPRNVTLGEAPSHGEPVILYDINSTGAQAYINLAEEILNGIKNS